MSVISKVSYSGLNVQNAEGLKGFERQDKWNGKPSAELKKEGVSYEKTIYDSASIGFSFLQSIEKRLSGIRFFAGTVSYGQTYGNSSDTNFVINPYFLERLGSNETVRKQFEEDVKYLYEFSQRFRAQQLSQGREIVNQGWFCDQTGKATNHSSGYDRLCRRNPTREIRRT